MDERKTMIEQALKAAGLVPEAWRESEDDGGPVAVVGRFRVLEDYDDRGFYEGDEGELVVEVVGAAEYRNQRAAWYFTPDGMDSPNELPGDPLEILEGA